MEQNLSVLSERLRVLFVDDDPILREFAEVHLSTAATAVDSASDGEEAWRRISAEAYDLVVLDIEMPKLDGFGLLERLRSDRRFQLLPVIMLTGREDVVSIDRSFELGANFFEIKPINWRVLSYVIRFVLRAASIEADLHEQRERCEALSQVANHLLSLNAATARATFGTLDEKSGRFAVSPAA